MLSRRYAYPNAEQMFKKVLPLLRANIEVRQSLGSNLQAGQFRAYAHTGGVCFTKALPFLSWNSRKSTYICNISDSHPQQFTCRPTGDDVSGSWSTVQCNGEYEL